MRELVRDGLASPLLVETAAPIYTAYCCDAERAWAIREFLQDHLQFVPDPDGQELLRTPEYLVTLIRDQGLAYGDCDDVAILGAALGMSIGIPARFVLLGFSPTGPFSHVYTELATPEGWQELDTTAPDQFPPGLRIHREKRVRV